MEKQGLLFIAGEDTKWYSHFGKVWQFLTKLNILLPYDPAITHLGIYPQALKTYVHTKTGTWMFTAILFVIAKTWKQPRCPSVGDWINKLWDI